MSWQSDIEQMYWDWKAKQNLATVPMAEPQPVVEKPVSAPQVEKPVQIPEIARLNFYYDKKKKMDRRPNWKGIRRGS